MSETETPREEPAHDILAAEAFAVPAPDPELHHHGPVLLPDDPTGIAEPHDVLAAEEFPMPAGRPHGPAATRLRTAGSFPRLAIAAVALLLAVLTVRGRGRR